MSRRFIADLGQGVQVHVVDWALPPNMKYIKKQNWCGQKDFIRLHALGPSWREAHKDFAHKDALELSLVTFGDMWRSMTIYGDSHLW